MQFLIVCTANLCRSPMAEAAMRRSLARRELLAEVRSAGVHAPFDEPAHPRSAQAAELAGLGPLAEHRSQPISASLLRASDIVLCMEQHHRRSIIKRAPAAAGRIWLLGHWQGVEVNDPVAGPLEEHQRCLRLMDECIGQWLDRLASQGMLRQRQVS